jgi:hypothetical protein
MTGGEVRDARPELETRSPQALHHVLRPPRQYKRDQHHVPVSPRHTGSMFSIPMPARCAHRRLPARELNAAGLRSGLERDHAGREHGTGHRVGATRDAGSRRACMGEAIFKRRRRQAFLKQHPICCFCGGSTPTTTVDHVPSIQMFTLRQRPQGLEAPACESCNQATRQHEQVAAMLGRIYPDGPTEAEREEVQRIMRSVKNNCPGLLEEMMPSQRQKQRFAQSRHSLPVHAAGALNCSGPLVNRSVQIFGAKRGFALHYATTGRIVPPEGGVAVRWYSNYDAMIGEIPAKLFEILGLPRTLKQGEWSVRDQFKYALLSLTKREWQLTSQPFANRSLYSRGSVRTSMISLLSKASRCIGRGNSVKPRHFSRTRDI